MATTARKRTSEMPLPTLEEEEREVPGEDVHMQLICALEEELQTWMSRTSARYVLRTEWIGRRNLGRKQVMSKKCKVFSTKAC